MNSNAIRIIERARARRLKIATAESCTGGLIAGAITGVPGASDVFGYGFVTYANPAKIDLLGVSPDMIEDRGAVSEQVAVAMADGALRRAAADRAVAVTGIAGPGGGSAEKPVGTVLFALARRGDATVAERQVFAGDREAIRAATVAHALEMLAESLGQ